MSPTDPRPRASSLVRLGLLALLAFAAATRLAGIDYLLPHLSEPDQYLVPQTEFLWEGGNPKAAPLSFFWYYSLLPQVLALTPDPLRAVGRIDPSALHEHLRLASAPILRMRVLVALLALLAVPGTYLLARRFLGRAESLLAAALLATSLLHLQFSNQARPHAAQTSLALLAVLAALRMRARPTMGAYWLAGLACALAIGCLQNGVFVLPPLLLAHLLRERGSAPSPERASGPDAWRRAPFRDLRKLALALACFGASLLWFGPSFNEPQLDTRVTRAPFGRNATPALDSDIASYTDTIAVRDGSIQLGPQRLELRWFDGSGFRQSLKFLWWNDPVLLVLGAAGALAVLLLVARAWLAIPRALRKPPVLGALDRLLADPRARDLAIAAAYVIPYVLVLCSYARTWGRFLLPALPYIACLSAFAAAIPLRALAGRLRSARARMIASGLLAAAILALPAAGSLQRARLQTRVDTVELAADWIARNVDRRSARILLDPSLNLPLFSRREALDLDLRSTSGQAARWLCYQDLFLPPAGEDRGYELIMVPQRRETRELLVREGGAEEFLHGGGFEYAVIEVSQRMSIAAPLRKLHEAVRAQGELVARFSARRPEASDLLWKDYQDAPSMLWRTFRADTLGPRIEIHRLRPGHGAAER